MNMPYLGESTDSILGKEFLTWLWYQSDTAPGAFTDKDGAPFAVSMEQRIVVEGGEGDARETASVSGSLSPLREARFGLGTGKQVSRALLRLEKEELAASASTGQGASRNSSDSRDGPADRSCDENLW